MTRSLTHGAKIGTQIYNKMHPEINANNYWIPAPFFFAGGGSASGSQAAHMWVLRAVPLVGGFIFYYILYIDRKQEPED